MTTNNNRLNKYKRNRVEKLEAIPTGVSIERRHKVFLDSHGLNLSAIVRDAVDALMNQVESAIEKQARKVVEVFNAGKVSPDAEIEKLEKIIKESEAESEK
jgi:hypothetical protein